MLLSEITHTDAAQQARFAALTPEQQMLEIWLNTRETNGHVAEAKRDIAQSQIDVAAIREWRDRELKAWMDSVDRKIVGATAIFAFILALAPFVFFTLNKWG